MVSILIQGVPDLAGHGLPHDGQRSRRRRGVTDAESANVERRRRRGLSTKRTAVEGLSRHPEHDRHLQGPLEERQRQQLAVRQRAVLRLPA